MVWACFPLQLKGHSDLASNPLLPMLDMLSSEEYWEETSGKSAQASAAAFNKAPIQVHWK